MSQPGWFIVAELRVGNDQTVNRQQLKKEHYVEEGSILSGLAVVFYGSYKLLACRVITTGVRDHDGEKGGK
jgi:hypothetical protein